MVSDIKDVLHNIMGKDKMDDYALNHMIQRIIIHLILSHDIMQNIFDV